MFYKHFLIERDSIGFYEIYKDLWGFKDFVILYRFYGGLIGF